MKQSPCKSGLMTPMFTSDFDYDLPAELIAQHPLLERDQSRMMVVRRKDGRIQHSCFRDIPDFLEKWSVLVLNNTRVIPARVWGRKDESQIEFLFIKEKGVGVWEVLCRPARKIGTGDVVVFGPGFEGKVVEVGSEGKRVLKFSRHDVLSELKKIGFAPLPPYIKRRKQQADLRRDDLARYQTVFARREGSIAAPTAGLHFTPRVLNRVREEGVKVCYVTLDVGLATFQPVRADRVEEHDMLEETCTVSPAAAREINKAGEEGSPVVAVGTTVVRTLESAFRDGRVHPGRRSTDLFIYPGYEFRVVDALLTNFHLPRSTLLMLVSAFAGIDLIKEAYAEAVRERYRFFSYGDCMLLL